MCAAFKKLERNHGTGKLHKKISVEEENMKKYIFYDEEFYTEKYNRLTPVSEYLK
jgi:hypothetical protein